MASSNLIAHRKQTYSPPSLLLSSPRLGARKKNENLHPLVNKIIVCPAGVYTLLKQLSVYKVTVTDKIPARLLKAFALELTQVITLVFQTPLDHGMVPDDWKEADATLIYKKGERNKNENYRAISLYFNLL